MKTIQGNRSNESHSPPVNLHQLMKLTSRRSNAIAHRKNLSHMQYLQVHQKMNVSPNFQQQKIQYYKAIICPSSCQKTTPR